MSGYVDKPREPMNRERVLALAVAVIAALAMAFIAVYASKVAMGFIGQIGRIPPTAPLMFVLGASFMLQSPTDDGASRTAIGRRRIAIFFYILGAVMCALPFIIQN